MKKKEKGCLVCLIANLEGFFQQLALPFRLGLFEHQAHCGAHPATENSSGALVVLSKLLFNLSSRAFAEQRKRAREPISRIHVKGNRYSCKTSCSYRPMRRDLSGKTFCLFEAQERAPQKVSENASHAHLLDSYFHVLFSLWNTNHSKDAEPTKTVFP